MIEIKIITFEKSPNCFVYLRFSFLIYSGKSELSSLDVLRILVSTPETFEI